MRRLGWRLRCTVYYCISFVGLGMSMSLLGPTLPALAERLGLEGPTKLGPVFVARGLGYFLGTLAFGALADRYETRAHAMLAGSSCLLGVATAAVPHAPDLASVVAVAAVMSLAGGAVDVGGNVLLVHVWGDHRGAGPAMNLLHAAWGAGSALAPLVARAVGLNPGGMPAVFGAIGALALLAGVTPVLVAPPRVSAPAAAAAAAAATAAAASSQRQEQRKGGGRAEAAAVAVAVVPRSRFALCIGGMFCYYLAYAGAEKMPGDWIQTVAMHPGGIGATEHEGATATSAFWGALLLGRVLSVPLAWWLSTSQLVASEFALALCSSAALVTYGTRSYGALLMSVTGIGLGLAALYPSGILLAKQKVPLTSAWISRFIIGGLVGSASLPAVVGATLETDVAAFGYAELLCVALCAACFGVVAAMPPLPTAPALSALDATAGGQELHAVSAHGVQLATPAGAQVAAI